MIANLDNILCVDVVKRKKITEVQQLILQWQKKALVEEKIILKKILSKGLKRKKAIFDRVSRTLYTSRAVPYYGGMLSR